MLFFFLNSNLERKGIEDTAVDDDFEIALEEAADKDNRPNNNRPNKKQKTGKPSKRTYKVSIIRL